MVPLRFLVVLLVLASIEGTRAAVGVDISSQACQSGFSLSDWQCLKGQGMSFAIIEVVQGGYGIDSNIARCVSDAWTAGFSHVDIYVFMCPNCNGNNPPEALIDSIYQATVAQGVNFGMLWFDIEQCDGCWNDPASNMAFIQRGVKEAVAKGFKVGIYSSVYEWGQTVGSSTALSNFPLWYAHYDGEPNFNDAWAYQFGGWTRPAMKQFMDNGPCNVDVDRSWYPDSE